MTVTAMRPSSPAGSPAVSRRQVSPPSVLFHRPLPGPPESNEYGVRRNCHVVAYSTDGSAGSCAMSAQPVVSST